MGSKLGWIPSKAPGTNLQNTGRMDSQATWPKTFVLIPQVMLLEHTPPGSAILSVSATDRDSGANGHISYHLTSPAEGFSVDPNNGASFPCLTPYL